MKKYLFKVIFFVRGIVRLPEKAKDLKFGFLEGPRVSATKIERPMDGDCKSPSRRFINKTTIKVNKKNHATHLTNVASRA